MDRQERLNFLTTLIVTKKRDVEVSIKLEVLDIQTMYNHIRAGIIQEAYTLSNSILVRKYDAAVVDYLGDCL